MQPEQIKQLIENGLSDSQASVQGDGSHFETIVVSDAFTGKTMLQEQKMVYATLGDRLATGELHALSIKAYTTEEWEAAGRPQVG